MASPSPLLPTKKIRLAEPDLKILVGTEDNQKEYCYHGLAMALLSSHIDTVLSSSKKGTDALSLSFPDITPVQWHQMMQYLEPGNLDRPDADAAMELLVFYAKYGFDIGVLVCDQVLADHIGEKYINRINNADWIKIFVFATNHDLKLARSIGVKRFPGVLQCFRRRVDWPVQKPPSPFLKSGDIEAIRLLLPLLANNNDDLWIQIKAKVRDALPEGEKQELMREKHFPTMLLSALYTANGDGPV